MSGELAVDIIAEGLRAVATEGHKGAPGARDDGQLWGAFPNSMTLHDLAAHVVSVLAASGHTIVPSEGIVRTYQAASTLGSRYMLPKNFGCDREEAERWFELHQSALDGLPGVDTVRLEYRDEFATGWLPLIAAAAADEEDQ